MTGQAATEMTFDTAPDSGRAVDVTAPLTDAASANIAATGVSSESHPSSGPSVGNREVWIREVLNRFEGPLLSFAHRITLDLDLARDVVQETLLEACRQGPDALDGHIAQWLFRVCRNRALDYQRKEKRMAVVSEMDLLQTASESGPAEQLAKDEDCSRLVQLLTRLSANQQEVIRLKFQHDLKYREIADVTGLSVSNVGFLLHSGLKRLRELLGGNENE